MCHMEGPEPQFVARDAAGLDDRLPLLRWYRCGLTRSAMSKCPLARRLYRTPRQGAGPAHDHQPHALKNALLTVVTFDRHRIQVSARRPRRDRAGVQPERHRPPDCLSVKNQDYTLTQALVRSRHDWLVLSNLGVDHALAWLDAPIRWPTPSSPEGLIRWTIENRPDRQPGVPVLLDEHGPPRALGRYRHLFFAASRSARSGWWWC